MEFQQLISSTQTGVRSPSKEARFSFIQGGYVEDSDLQGIYFPVTIKIKPGIFQAHHKLLNMSSKYALTSITCKVYHGKKQCRVASICCMCTSFTHQIPLPMRNI